jgi:hypothetical protein
VVGLDLACDVVEAALLGHDRLALGRLPGPLLEDRHQSVPVQGLDHQCAAGSQHAQELVEHLPVALLAAVSDRREEVEDGIEAVVLERELAKVRLHEAGPVGPGCPASSFLELHR